MGKKEEHLIRDAVSPVFLMTQKTVSCEKLVMVNEYKLESNSLSNTNVKFYKYFAYLVLCTSVI